MIDEALKLALEALEESKTNNDTMEFHDRKDKAITAIKQARSAPAQEPVAWRLLDDEPGQTPRWQYYDKSDFKDGVNPMCVYPQLVALYTTPPAQPAPVPDLTHDQWDQWQDKHGLILEREALDHLRSMLYTTPPAAQPAPVPLTDDQIRGLTPKPDGVAEGNVRRVEVLPGVMGTEFDEVDAWSMPLVLQIARAIEAAHGITKGQS